jgi:hypothetical protein
MICHQPQNSVLASQVFTTQEVYKSVEHAIIVVILAPVEIQQITVQVAIPQAIKGILS